MIKINKDKNQKNIGEKKKERKKYFYKLLNDLKNKIIEKNKIKLNNNKEENKIINKR